LNGSSTLPSRSSDVNSCMAANQASREAYWGAYPAEQE